MGGYALEPRSGVVIWGRHTPVAGSDRRSLSYGYSERDRPSCEGDRAKTRESADVVARARTQPLNFLSRAS